MSKKPLRIVSGVVFVLYAASALLLPLPHLCLAALIVGIGLFVNKPVVSAVGGIIFAAGILYNAGFRGRLNVAFPFGLSLNGGLLYRSVLFAAAICLVIICFARSAGKVLSILSAVIALAAQGESILTVLRSTTFRLTYLDYVSDLLLSLGLLLFGFAFHQKKGTAKKKQTAEISPSKSSPTMIDNSNHANSTHSIEVYKLATVKGSEHGMKKNFWYIIGILAGVAAIVVGIVFLCESGTYIGRSYSFGADFYTEIYAVARNVGYAINNAFMGIMSAFGWLFILGGLVDICVFASKVERKKKITPQADSSEPDLTDLQ
jgi:hypothetical protein